MRQLGFVGLALALTVVIHLNWHLALPESHPYHLDWFPLWVLPALGFAAVGWVVARFWPERPLRTALGMALLAIVLNQGLIPLIAVAIDEGRLGYPTDPLWWSGFFVSMVVGLPALLLAAHFLRRRSGAVGLSSAA